jgi:hypothetical protein
MKPPQKQAGGTRSHAEPSQDPSRGGAQDDAGKEQHEYKPGDPDRQAEIKNAVSSLFSGTSQLSHQGLVHRRE